MQTSSAREPSVKSHSPERVAVEIRGRGRVQGVGFRRTVWRLTRELRPRGEVLNDAQGVFVRAGGDPRQISAFIKSLKIASPLFAQINAFETHDFISELLDDFRIAESVDADAHTEISPGAAICAACAAETLTPVARRYRYPFTNCTHCGPRLTIIRAIRYDGGKTTKDDTLHSHAYDHLAPHRHDEQDPDHGHDRNHFNKEVHHHLHFRRHGNSLDHKHSFDKNILTIESRIFTKNDPLAAKRLALFSGRESLALNLVSSPESGKTTLLERTVTSLARESSSVVIEGDQANANDGEYIRAGEVPVVQNNSETGCHLDAEMVTRAVSELKPRSGAVAFIETVGILVCPAPFDLTLANSHHVYPDATTLEDSAPNGEGNGAWYNRIRDQALASRQFGLV